MTAIAADRIGKRYGRHWALRDCTLAIPDGAVVGLVGANGAGKTTLLHLVVGLLEPSEGALSVLGAAPRTGLAAATRVGFVAQHAPLYSSLTVDEHLRFGAEMNAAWDQELALARVERIGLPGNQRAGRLSGGQRAQLALTLAIGTHPELLVLDEPVASLDPVARQQFLADLMALAADEAPTVVLSSHLLSDIERVCDYLVVVAAGRVPVAGEIDALLMEHKLLVGPRRDLSSLPREQQVVSASHTDRQTTVMVRTTAPILDPRWAVSDVGVEQLVLAYMTGAEHERRNPDLAGVPA